MSGFCPMDNMLFKEFMNLLIYTLQKSFFKTKFVSNIDEIFKF